MRASLYRRFIGGYDVLFFTTLLVGSELFYGQSIDVSELVISLTTYSLLGSRFRKNYQTFQSTFPSSYLQEVLTTFLLSLVEMAAFVLLLSIKYPFDRTLAYTGLVIFASCINHWTQKLKTEEMNLQTSGIVTIVAFISYSSFLLSILFLKLPTAILIIVVISVVKSLYYTYLSYYTEQSLKTTYKPSIFGG